MIIVEVTIALQRHWKSSIASMEMRVSDEPVIKVGILEIGVILRPIPDTVPITSISFLQNQRTGEILFSTRRRREYTL